MSMISLIEHQTDNTSKVFAKFEGAVSAWVCIDIDNVADTEVFPTAWAEAYKKDQPGEHRSSHKSH